MATRHIPWARIFAEGVAIVVSILLALGIQAWWENRQDRELERRYIDSLIENLQSDTASVATILSETRKRAGYGQRVLTAYETGTRPGSPQDFARAVEYADYFSVPGYMTNTIDDLISTGNLRLIRSDEVRDALSRYYDEIEWTGQFREEQYAVQGELGARIAAILGLEHRCALLNEGYQGQCGTAGFTCTGDTPIPWGPAELDVSEHEADQILKRLLATPDARPLYAQMARTQGLHFANLTSIHELAVGALTTLERNRDEGW